MMVIDKIIYRTRVGIWFTEFNYEWVSESSIDKFLFCGGSY